MPMRNIYPLAITAALIFSGPAMAQKVDKNSQSFISTAIKHNYAEIDAGKLAQEKGTNPSVKEFGAMLVREHSEANTKAQAVAKQLNVDPPTGADVAHQATYLKLKVLSGNAFDTSFINGMVKDHDNDVKEFTRQSSKKDASGEHAKEILPKLQKHLAEAKSIQAQLKKKK